VLRRHLGSADVRRWRREWADAVRSARTHMTADRVNVAAGAFAYRWFLAIFPVVIALLGVASLVTVPRHVVVSLIHGVTRALPPGAAVVFTSAISNVDHHSPGDLVTTVVAAAVGLWSATSGMAMVLDGIDMAYDLSHDRTFLANRLATLPLLAATALLGGAASALVVFGPQLDRLVHGGLPGTLFSAVWTAVRWVVALALMTLLFSVLYNVAPNRTRRRWQWVSPGAILATVLWAVVSLGFSVYTSSVGSYTRTYGAFAGVAILIFWLYLTGLAVLVGGELNAAFERGRDGAGPVGPPVAASPAGRQVADGVP
jgi:membrane protein